jgi:hypothetical protein
MKRPDLSARNTTHGMSKLPEYDLWCGMKQRCYYTKHKSYAQYGGKGIRVCDRWLSFENFYADMGKKPEGMTLDRIDISKDYSPENCKWSTYKEQMRNTSRSKFIEHEGRVLCLTDWAKELGKTTSCLGQRAYRGWSDKEILFGRNAA